MNMSAHFASNNNNTQMAKVDTFSLHMQLSHEISQVYYKGCVDNAMVILKVKNGGRAASQGNDEQFRQAANRAPLQP